MSRLALVAGVVLILAGTARAEDFGEKIPASKADVVRLEAKIDALTAAVDRLTATMTEQRRLAAAPPVVTAPTVQVTGDSLGRVSSRVVGEPIYVPSTPRITYAPAPVRYYSDPVMVGEGEDVCGSTQLYAGFAAAGACGAPGVSYAGPAASYGGPSVSFTGPFGRTTAGAGSPGGSCTTVTGPFGRTRTTCR